MAATRRVTMLRTPWFIHTTRHISILRISFYPFLSLISFIRRFFIRRERERDGPPSNYTPLHTAGRPIGTALSAKSRYRRMESILVRQNITCVLSRPRSLRFFFFPSAAPNGRRKIGNRKENCAHGVCNRATAKQHAGGGKERKRERDD